MKFVLFALTFLLSLPAMATTWYVRADGGTRYSATVKSGQCNGTADAAYPGHGTDQPCAFNDPRLLYSDGTGAPYQWTIAGGDTVLLRGGPWRIGSGALNGCGPFSNGCTSDGAYMPPPPAGTASQPTTIRGEHFASCAAAGAKTQLFGGFSINGVFNLRATHNVQVECLDLTDHSQCVVGKRPPVSCDTNPDFAKSGILTDQNTHDITLTDLDVHGFRDNGILGPVGGLVTATRVRVAFNGSSGWNYDDGFSTKSVNGRMAWSYVTIEGNGCVEEYPLTHSFPAAYCYDDGNGGYGDGVGTPDTQISFTIDHSTIRYNTQDGLDLLHTSGSNITIANSSFYGNMGQQLKLGPMSSTSVTNSLFLTNCKRMSANIPGAPAGWNAGLSDFCRAQAGVVMVQHGDDAGGGSYVWQNNDFVGYAGDAMFEIASCTDTFVSKPTNDCRTPNITFQNNLMVGYPYVVPTYHYGDLPPSGTDGGNKAHFRAIDHNIYYNMRSCPKEPGSVCTDPHLVGEPAFTQGVPIPETAFDSVNFALTEASTNAIGTGLSIPGMSVDYNGATRTLPTTIGALVYVGPTPSRPAPPTPAPTQPKAGKPRASAVFSITPNSTHSGQTVTATVDVSGSDSPTPTGTVTFYLPSGAVQQSLSGGVARVTFPLEGAGTYTMTAAYSGDGTYAAVISNQASVTVKGGATSDEAIVAAGAGASMPSSAAVSASTQRFAPVSSSVSAASSAAAVPTSSCQQPMQADGTLPAAAGGCVSAAQVSIVPVYRTLYAKQSAALQSLVSGDANQDVIWSLLAQPLGGDGKLLSTSSRDTVFSATVAGRYTLVATSLADPAQTATATLYVTGHPMPYTATALGTEPVDCTVDPALLGATYDVGPSQPYAHLRDVPLASIGAGTTIRIHNEDTSGTNPTTYHEYIEVWQHATADQPLRVCGVPDSTGHLPILDATDATAAGAITAPAGTLTIVPALSASAAAPANIQIEGLQLRNASASVSYQGADGAAASWAAGAACLDITGGQNIVMIGNDLGHCGAGGHSGPDSATLNTLWEGNRLHDNGVAGSALGSQLSIEATGEVVQFNRFDSSPAGVLGANIRSVGSSNVIRYNYLGNGPAHQIDLVGLGNTSGTLVTLTSGQAAYDAALAQVSQAQLIYGNVDEGSISALANAGTSAPETFAVAPPPTTNK